MALRLQSSVHGKIRRLLMVEEEGLTNDERESFLEILLQVYENKPAHTQLIVWSESLDESQSLATWFRREVGQVVVANDTNDSNPSVLLLLSPVAGRTLPFRRWVRDSFLIFEGCNNSLSTLTLSKNKQGRIVNELDLIGLHSEMRVTDLLIFAGGDILVVDDLVLVGQSTIQATENNLYLGCKLAPDKKRTRVLSLIAELLDIRVDKIVPIELPENETLAFFFKKNWCFLQKATAKHGLAPIDPELIHIDIFITPTGEIKNSKPLIFLATLVDLNTGDANRVKELNEKLDMIEALLMMRFEVVRNKVPYIRLKNGGWTFLFYNNCIVENSSDMKWVWLPDHLRHLSSLDVVDVVELTNIQCENYGLWTALYFNIVPIKADFIPFLIEQGSLHCLTKELEREIQ